jgi:tripartite-type tricarboxylate transporter receptor subunit TctC
MTLQNMGAILPVVRDGKLRGLAVTSLKRSSIISELPTLAESGFSEFEAISWFGSRSAYWEKARITAARDRRPS